MQERSDDEGFEAFFAARRGALCRAAFFLTGNDDAAEELFQSAMVQAYARWGHIARRSDDPEAYVRMIMLNKTRDNWRSLVRQKKRAHETHARHFVADTTDVVLEREVIGDLLRQLAPQQRAVLFFRFGLDYSEAQTAEALRCRIGTVKSQTHKALSRLRRLTTEALDIGAN